MKVTFERVIPNEKSSFRTIHNNSPISEFKWEYHYHPEIELVCVISGNGTRHVGYHKSNYTNGDLVLIGSNIPHSGFGLNSIDPHEEIVLQFKEEILQFPEQEVESRSIKNLLELSKYGIHFHHKVKKVMLPRLKLMLESEGYKRYLLLLEILFELSKCEDYDLLNKEIMPYTIISKNKTRLENIFTYVEHHYDKEIDIEECVDRMMQYEDKDATVSEVLLDQRVVSGVGNVFRCEIMWACEVHPWARIGEMKRAECR
ncbi:AraC family ligand binding domain-containing protein, partial [Chryseobacterium cucumeris]|uniref:AraC family ligand binding domain-containing protein n=1 Tax=Chryseobacterium cucumeris TaxID=1813611 RepID=UPI0023F221F8